METIALGLGTAAGVSFANAASAADDLGGGRIYAALVKQAVLKRLGLADAAVRSLKHGNGSAEDLTLGATGAVIADTTDKTNIPMQIVCPETFEAELNAEIASETGTTMALCSVGEFLDCFIAVCDRQTVAAWDTFATWFDGYRQYLNDSIGNAAMTITTLDGDDYVGSCQQMGAVSKLSDIFAWLKSCLSPVMLARPTSEIIADDNPQKLGMVCTMTGLEGTYGSLYGSTAVMHFYIRL